MSDQPTPETDALIKAWGDYLIVERNEARERLAEALRSKERILKRAERIRCELVQALNERDEARDQLHRIASEGFDHQDTIGGEACADYVLRKLKQERLLHTKAKEAFQ